MINWNSPKQVIPLFKHLGFDLLAKDKETGEWKDSVGYIIKAYFYWEYPADEDLLYDPDGSETMYEKGTLQYITKNFKTFELEYEPD